MLQNVHSHASGRVGLGLALIVTGLILGAPPSLGQDQYVARLNRPITVISEENKAYEIYFAAYTTMDADGAPLESSELHIGAGNLGAAVAWVGAAEQQEAVDLLLADDRGRPNVTYREILGLPYGVENVAEDMILEDFVIYLEKGQLRSADLAYLRPLDSLRYLLIAEGHRSWNEGDSARGAESFAAACRIARQIIDRDYLAEKKHGILALIDTARILREAMWSYRANISVRDYERLGEELEMLMVDRMSLPRANRLAAEQLVEEVYADDNRPDETAFASVLARYESRDQPLKLFEASAKWRELRPRHANLIDVRRMVENVDGDYRRRWQYRWHDPALESENPLFETMDPIQFAVVKLAYEGIELLFEERYRLLTEINGTITSAGVAGFQKRDGVAPVALDQVQPGLVDSQASLIDPYTDNDDELQYAVIRRRDAAGVALGYDVRTPFGTVHLSNGTPLLHSVGWDGSNQYGARAVRDPEGKPGGDLVFWPPVFMLARTGEEAKF